MKQILTILFVIFSIIPIQSAALSTSDVPSITKSASTSSTILTIPKLIESVCEKLKTQELTFVSQVPEEVYASFISGIKKASIVLAEKNSSRKEILEVLKSKAVSLYETKQLTSMWLMYLGLGCAKLLGNFDGPLFLWLKGATFEEEFNTFTYVHDNRNKLRKPMREWVIAQRGTLGSTSEEPKLTIDDISLPFNACIELNQIIHTDCFWLPIISRKPLFSPATFNKAMVHRIALVGVPLEETEGFDGILQTSPYAFADHDIEHAAEICFLHYREGKINPDIIFSHLGFEEDPVVFLWQPIWNFIQSNTDETQKKIDEFTLFWLIHEAIIKTEESSTFQNVIETALSRERQEHDCDYSSGKEYWISKLGIEKESSVRSAYDNCNLDEEGCASVICRSPDGTEKEYWGIGYLQSKRNLQEQIKYLRSIKSSLFDPSIESSGEIGRVFCAFLGTVNKLNKKG